MVISADLPVALSALEAHHEFFWVVIQQPLPELLTLALVVAPAVMEFLCTSGSRLDHWEGTMGGGRWDGAGRDHAVARIEFTL